MTTSYIPGPQSIGGATPLVTGPTSPIGGSPALGNENPDFSPSLSWMGWGVRDPRYLAHIGAGSLVSGAYPNQDCGWFFAGGGIIAIDQVPPTLSNTNLAAAQAPASGTALTLAGASTGITVQSGTVTVLPTGNVVPTATLVIDGLPAWTGSGSGAFAFMNPATAYGRGISVTANAGATGGAVKIVGYDVYGALVHETITAVAASTVGSVKTYKWLLSVTPQFTDAGHTYSVGTADVFGLSLYASKSAATKIVWDGTLVTASTGFTAGVASAGTATSSDNRGKYAVQSAADGAKRLTIYQALDYGVIASTVAASVAALVGPAQFSA